MRKINDVLKSDMLAVDKIAFIRQEYSTEIEAANKANRGLAVELINNMLTTLRQQKRRAIEGPNGSLKKVTRFSVMSSKVLSSMLMETVTRLLREMPLS